MTRWKRAQKLQRQSQGLVFTKASPVYQTLGLGYLAWNLASFYTSTIKVNDVPMGPAAVAAQFAPLFSAFPD